MSATGIGVGSDGMESGTPTHTFTTKGTTSNKSYRYASFWLTIFQVSSMQLFMKQNMPENQLAPRMNLSNRQLNLVSTSRAFEQTTESMLLSCFGILVKKGNKTSHSALLVPTGKMARQKASLALQLAMLVLFYYMPCLYGLMLYIKTGGLSLSIMLLISTIHPHANIKRIHRTNYSPTKVPFGH